MIGGFQVGPFQPAYQQARAQQGGKDSNGEDDRRKRTKPAEITVDPYLTRRELTRFARGARVRVVPQAVVPAPIAGRAADATVPPVLDAVAADIEGVRAAAAERQRLERERIEQMDEEEAVFLLIVAAHTLH